MDDLSARRNIISEPNQLDAETLAAIKQDSKKAALLDDMQALDNKIAQALNKVDVPEGLQQRLILKQSIADFKQSERKRNRWAMGIAASVAFACSLAMSAWLYQPVNTQQVAQYAFDHIYHEMSYANTVNEQVTLQQVNAKLASFGGEITGQLTNKEITYANFCDLNGLKSLHLVMQTATGERMTVFILPKNNTLDGWQTFSDDRLKGTTERYQRADMIVIGDKKGDIDGFRRQLSQSLRWQA